ncbi:uncharacterized protein METZ01_LOCUS495427 [marine metagenome]|uniref:Uncharacterized protein n=1 Tax=marine metagenome TaxID=408172 RepID=A0A383DE27_9ZZZZ
MHLAVATKEAAKSSPIGFRDFTWRYLRHLNSRSRRDFTMPEAKRPRFHDNQRSKSAEKGSVVVSLHRRAENSQNFGTSYFVNHFSIFLCSL